MNNGFTVAGIEDKDEVFNAYYSYFTMMYGAGFGRGFVNRAINNKNYNSKTAAFIDTAYEKASEIVNDFLPNAGIIKIEGEDGSKAYFRISYQSKINELSAHIGEIVLLGSNLERTKGLVNVIGIIEKELRASVPDLSRVSYEAIPGDETMIVALEECGYFHTPSNADSKFFTIIFEKSLLEEDVSRS